MLSRLHFGHILVFCIFHILFRFDIGQGTVQIYAFDPSGWTFQLDWLEGNDAPRKIASYSAACKSNDGCYGQGLCNEEEDVFTPF